MKKAIFTLAILFTAIAANAEEKNCKLIIQTKYFDGKKVVNFEHVYAGTYDECKAAAQNRTLANEGDKQQNVKVAFGYRKPADLK